MKQTNKPTLLKYYTWLKLTMLSTMVKQKWPFSKKRRKKDNQGWLSKRIVLMRERAQGLWVKTSRLIFDLHHARSMLKIAWPSSVCRYSFCCWHCLTSPLFTFLLLLLFAASVYNYSDITYYSPLSRILLSHLVRGWQVWICSTCNFIHCFVSDVKFCYK